MYDFLKSSLAKYWKDKLSKIKDNNISSYINNANK